MHINQHVCLESSNFASQNLFLSGLTTINMPTQYCGPHKQCAGCTHDRRWSNEHTPCAHAIWKASAGYSVAFEDPETLHCQACALEMWEAWCKKTGHVELKPFQAKGTKPQDKAKSSAPPPALKAKLVPNQMSGRQWRPKSDASDVSMTSNSKSAVRNSKSGSNGSWA